MKKAFLMLVASAVAVLMFSGMTACKEVAKSVNGTSSDSDSVAQELPRTLDNAPKPEGNVTTWLVAGFLEDGGYKMFIVDGDESRFVQDNLGDTDTIYVLRLVSYKQTKEENEALEDGGTFKEIEGDMVVDAYDPATKAFAGRYEGQYTSGGEYDKSGELLHCGETYAGTFTKADGEKEEFSYYGD